jgi:hypothetical protein
MKQKGPSPDLIVFVAASLFATIIGVVLDKFLPPAPPPRKIDDDRPPQR